MVYQFTYDDGIYCNIITGLATQIYTSCQLVRVSGVDIPYEQVPSGLFPLNPVLCGFQVNPPW